MAEDELVPTEQRLDALEGKARELAERLRGQMNRLRAVEAGAQAASEKVRALTPVAEEVSKLKEAVETTGKTVQETAAAVEKVSFIGDERVKERILTVCDVSPELCKLVPAKGEGEDHAHDDHDHPHEVIMAALMEAGQKALGRAPTWGDLLESCPDGQCRLAVLKTIAKRQPMLVEMAKLEGGAEAMIQALTEAGKITEAKTEEEHIGEQVGWFANRARREQQG
jgi:hypothetical protein